MKTSFFFLLWIPTSVCFVTVFISNVSPNFRTFIIFLLYHSCYVSSALYHLSFFNISFFFFAVLLPDWVLCADGMDASNAQMGMLQIFSCRLLVIFSYKYVVGGKHYQRLLGMRNRSIHMPHPSLSVPLPITFCNSNMSPTRQSGSGQSLPLSTFLHSRNDRNHTLRLVRCHVKVLSHLKKEMEKGGNSYCFLSLDSQSLAEYFLI